MIPPTLTLTSALIPGDALSMTLDRRVDCSFERLSSTLYAHSAVGKFVHNHNDDKTTTCIGRTGSLKVAKEASTRSRGSGSTKNLKGHLFLDHSAEEPFGVDLVFRSGPHFREFSNVGDCTRVKDEEAQQQAAGSRQQH